jgi:SsrA-binding protein
MAKSKKKQSVVSGKVIVRNRKAHFDYHIFERMEAGIVLKGSEVKSLRAGKMNIAESYVEVENWELFLVNSNISEYSFSNRNNHEPKRKRKLLMHKREILRISIKKKEKGYSIIPLTVYFSPKGKIKVEIALVKGKKAYDKRQTIKERDEKRFQKNGEY